MKHYAPSRCEPGIEVIVKMGVRLGRGVDVNEELVIWNEKKKSSGGERGGRLEEGGVRVDVNKQLKLL